MQHCCFKSICTTCTRPIPPWANPQKLPTHANNPKNYHIGTPINQAPDELQYFTYPTNVGKEWTPIINLYNISHSTTPTISVTIFTTPCTTKYESRNTTNDAKHHQPRWMHPPWGVDTTTLKKVKTLSWHRQNKEVNMAIELKTTTEHSQKSLYPDH